MKNYCRAVVFLFAAAILSLSFVDGGYSRQVVSQAQGTLKDIGKIAKESGGRKSFKAIHTCCTLIRGGKKTKKKNVGRKSITKGLIIFHHLIYLYLN